MAPKSPPAGYHTATPYLIVDNASAAIDFYKKAFGATEITRFEHEGRIGHAELRLGDSVIMLGDAMPEMGYQSASALGGSPVSIMLYVADVDSTFDRAVAAGGKARSPVQNQFWGDRSGNLTDPFGHQWTLASHVEDVAPEEMRRRFHEMMASHGKA